MSEPGAARRSWRGSVTTWGLAALLALGLFLIWHAMPGEAGGDAPLPAPFVADAVGPAGDAPDAAPGVLPPNHLAIASIGVSAPLVPGRLVPSSGFRSLEVPEDVGTLTRYADGPGPCDASGTVVIAGHVAVRGTKGALWDLHRIAPRAGVTLTCADGAVTTWRAVRVTVVPKDDLPADLFAAGGALRAVIITCGGPVLADGHYRDNVVVELRREKVVPARP